MARTVRNANLETRTARARLERERFHWSSLAQGVALGYRRTKAGYGTWTVRALEQDAGKYVTDRIGRADDTEDADGNQVLTYHQAASKARAIALVTRGGKSEAIGPYSVAQAAEDYLAWFAAHRKSVEATKTVINAHILPRFGRRIAAELTKREIQSWHEKLASSPARARAARDAKEPRYREQDLRDPDVARKRKATANRILSVLRALLNHAWRDGRVPTDEAWRRVRPFRNASEPLVRYLSEDEARRLVDACADDLRALVRAALATGCRYGELTALRIGDFRAESSSIHVRESKSGRPRHVPLSDEGVGLFAKLGSGRSSGETLLTHSGRPWGKNHQVRELAAACSRARITPAASFHVLRHTYGSWLALRGVPLQVIAELLGHSDTRITHKHYAHLSPDYKAAVVRRHLPKISLATRRDARERENQELAKAA